MLAQILKNQIFQKTLNLLLHLTIELVVAQSPSHVRPFVTPWTAMCQGLPGFAQVHVH